MGNIIQAQVATKVLLCVCVCVMLQKWQMEQVGGEMPHRRTAICDQNRTISCLHDMLALQTTREVWLGRTPSI